MSDGKVMAERRHVFHGRGDAAGQFGDADDTQFAMRLVPPARRWSVRGELFGQTVAGFDLTQPINELRTATNDNGTRTSMRLGPDEWLLIGDENGDATETALTGHSSEIVYTVVDISHRQIALEVTGAQAADVLNTGCPLDLSDKAFLVGTATRTLFAKVEIVLSRHETVDNRPVYRLECWRSFGRYLQAHLADSAVLIGAAAR